MMVGIGKECGFTPNFDMPRSFTPPKTELRRKMVNSQSDCRTASCIPRTRAVGLLKYAKRFLPQNSLKTLYTSIVEPHFRYCCAVWGCCGTTEISKLQKLQNRAARIITNSSFDASSKPLIQNLGWKTVNDMIKHESRTMVYKSINNIAPP